MLRARGVHRGYLLAWAVCVLALPACGRKTPVRPPELIAPDAIRALSVSNAPSGIHLSWRRPAHRADGTRLDDLAGFRIERSTTGTDFAVVATVEVTDRDRFRQTRRFTWTDTDAMVGETYQYRVISFTVDAYVSEPSNIATLKRAIPTPKPPATPTPSR